MTMDHTLPPRMITPMIYIENPNPSLDFKGSHWLILLCALLKGFGADGLGRKGRYLLAVGRNGSRLGRDLQIKSTIGTLGRQVLHLLCARPRAQRPLRVCEVIGIQIVRVSLDASNLPPYIPKH